jgi:hypothetical protein
VTVSDAILRRLEQAAGVEGLVDVLAERLQPHELTSERLCISGFGTERACAIWPVKTDLRYPAAP